MAELPTGTVTFLFSDVEGSTRLLTELRGRYADVLGEHQRLLREAFAAHDGRVVHTEGDAFFVAFARAGDAIAAAVSAQRALASKSWPEGTEVRVRIGVHTGEAEVRLDDYVGLDVHRAARICSAGHGGQVLISDATRALAADDLPADVVLRDLGEHRLKDLDRPEHVFQVVIGGLPADFPPLASLPSGSGLASGLPPPPNRTIGRADEVRAIVDRLHVDGVRLLTLTGPGGVGKTRVALESARAAEASFADGAYFVSLAPTARAEHAASAIAQALGVTPLQSESPGQAVERFLAPKRALLVLDNFEHLLAAAPLVGALLARCGGLAVLATSREPLRLQAEHCYAVAPLVVSPRTDRAAVSRAPASALFVERARSHDRGFELTEGNAGAVADICRRLDGLPLAIELAAARISLLDPDELSARLAQALDVLGTGPRDAPDRQRTLRATVDWSHRLLAAPEAAALAGFSVFAGGATTEAAEEVTGCDIDSLAGLVDKHLLLRSGAPGVDSRLMMLETVRDYASERLAESEDATEVHARHCRYYRALAERVEPELFTSAEAQWLPRLEAEVDNLRAALDWSLLNAPIDALDLVGSLALFWQTEDAFREGFERVEAALDAAGEDAPVRSRARALVALASLAPLGDPAHDQQVPGKRPRALVTEALALFRKIEDPVGVATSLLMLARWYDPDEPLTQGPPIALTEEALTWARLADDRRLVPEALMERALALPPEQADEAIEDAAQALRAIGDQWSLFRLYWYAAHHVLRTSNPEQAGALLDQALALASELHDPSDLMYESPTEGLYALFVDELDRAQSAFEEQLRFCRDRGVAYPARAALAGLAAIAARRTKDQRAAELLGAAIAIGPIEDAAVVEHLDKRFFTPARLRLGDHQWQHAHAAGAQLTFEQAIALALTRVGAAPDPSPVRANPTP